MLRLKSFAVALLAALAFACGGSAHVRLIQGHQAFETALETVDDAERLACWGSVTLPADPTTCTLPTADAPVISKKLHHDISIRIRDAFDHQTALVPILKGWTANTVPPDLSSAYSDALQIDMLLRSVGINTGGVFTAVAKWTKTLQDLQSALTAKKESTK